MFASPTLEDDRVLDALPHAVAVITPTIPSRAELLVEACESVAAQTIPCIHHVYLDHDRHGPAIIRNTIMMRLSCEWVAFLDDDDLLDDDHLELLYEAAVEQSADVAFSWYRSQGAPETERVEAFDDYALGVMLSGRNLVPVTVVARREAVLEAGGFWPEDRYEDHALWLRMLARGSRFACVPRETWTYRMQGGNRTWLQA